MDVGLALGGRLGGPAHPGDDCRYAVAVVKG